MPVRAARPPPRRCVVRASTTASTVSADVERTPPSRTPADVRFPSIPPDSPVLLDRSPVACTAVSRAGSFAFLGVGRSVVAPAGSGLFGARSERIARGHTGPVWGVEHPGSHPGEPEATPAASGLRRRPECAQISSDLDGNSPRLCRLERPADHAVRQAGPPARGRCRPRASIPGRCLDTPRNFAHTRRHTRMFTLPKASK